jgi:hypothetical protein
MDRWELSLDAWSWKLSQCNGGGFYKALKHKVIDGPSEGHMETWIDGITYELDKPRPGTS